MNDETCVTMDAIGPPFGTYLPTVAATMYSRRLYTANRHAAAAPAASTTNSVGRAADDGTLSVMAVNGRPKSQQTAALVNLLLKLGQRM